MIKTLALLRIKAQVVVVDGRKFGDMNTSMFRDFKLAEFARYELGPLDLLNDVEQALTARFLNLGDQVRANSGGALKQTAICFITAPVFITALPSKLYTVWMDLLSKDMSGVPVVFLRGNGEQQLIAINA